MKKIIGMFALVAMLAMPAMAPAASQLPAGFVAQSEEPMTWDEAKTYCQQKGGKLPLIGGSNSRSDVPSGTPIDSCGAVGTRWPAGLPSDFWTGTETPSYPGAWVVFDGAGFIGATSDGKSSAYNVLCVP